MAPVDYRLVNVISVLLLSATSIFGKSTSNCPSLCTCNEALTFVNCANARLTNVPKLPSTVTSVILDSNELTEIHNKSFVGLSRLKLLSINDNEISNLKKDDFLGLKRLLVLRLSGNKLSVLDDNVFNSVSTITELDLSRNKLKLIPDGSLEKCHQLRKVNLSTNAISSADFGPGFTKTRSLQVLDLSNNNLGILKSHSFSKMNHFGERIVLNLSNTNIREIQEGVFRNGQALHLLDLSRNRVDMSDLKKTLKELEISTVNTLKMSYMNISDVHFLFNGLSLGSLQELDLSHNAIEAVGKRSFSQLRQLRVFDLSHNMLTSVGDYSGQGELKHLRLSHNKIREIDYTSLEICEELISLFLDHNELEFIEDAPFENMYELEELDLSYNKITQFEIASAFEHLRVLKISSNRLQSLGSITRLRQVEKLDISGNKLTRLDKELFISGRVLNKVNFSNNAIREIEPDTFRSHTPTIIDLSHNKLTSIDKLGWTYARELHLQGNYMQSISRRFFVGLKWLKYLDLSNNTLSTIHATGFRDLRQLQELDLSHNDLGESLRSSRNIFNGKTVGLVTLNLASNGISVLDDEIFSNLSSLTNLDISNNRLLSLSDWWLHNTDTLKTLNASYNRIATVDPKHLDHLLQLKVLDLSRNPFMCNCDLADFRNWIDDTSVSVHNFNSNGYYLCDGPYSWKGIDLLHFQVHDNCKDPVDKRIILVVIGCTAFAIFLIAGIIFYQHRWRIKRKMARNQDYRAIYDNNGSGAVSATSSLPPPAPARQYGGRDWV